MVAVLGQCAGWWWWWWWSALIRRDVRARAAPARARRPPRQSPAARPRERPYRAHRSAWRTTPARAAGPRASCGAAARARPATCCTSSTAACRPRRPRSCCRSTSTTPSLASAGAVPHHHRDGDGHFTIYCDFELHSRYVVGINNNCDTYFYRSTAFSTKYVGNREIAVCSMHIA